jgi:hypothetical protein
MAFTRFYDDPCRIQKHLEESTNIGNYFLEIPGNGDKPHYINDPHIRLQKWGANLSINQIDLENDLRCQTRLLNRDLVKENNYNNYINNTNSYLKNIYPNIDNEITGQSRVTHPVYEYREINAFENDKSHNNFKYLHMNPQENICIPFQNNISTRIVEKDYFRLNK